jgi:hypothetical protein
VNGADTVGRDTRGYDAGKKINGRKRFIVTDTLGLLLVVVVMAASRQDRDGAKSALLDTRLRTRVRFVFADGGFAGRLLDWAQTMLATTLHIVRRPTAQPGFAVIPRRWAVGGPSPGSPPIAAWRRTTNAARRGRPAVPPQQRTIQPVT